MEHYEKAAYAGLLIQGRLREAIQYLTQFPQKQRMMQRTLSVFEHGKTLKRSDNEVIHRIDAVYQAYYRMVFWQQADRDEAAVHLYTALCSLLHVQPEAAPEDIHTALEKTEFAAGEAAAHQGFCFLGGTTSGYYGPYIWKSTEPVAYDIALPQGRCTLTVNMMDGFISRSWLDFLSFGKIGTGGWAGEDGQLYCVRSAYAREMDKPSFRISYLMHEAQHMQDRERYPGISSMHMEYRAKLVEIIGYPRMSKFKSFLREASDSDAANAHSFASYLIVRNLSERVLGVGYESDYTKWKDTLSKIRHHARILLDEYPRGL